MESCVKAENHARDSPKGAGSQWGSLDALREDAWVRLWCLVLQG